MEGEKRGRRKGKQHPRAAYLPQSYIYLVGYLLRSSDTVKSHDLELVRNLNVEKSLCERQLCLSQVNVPHF